MRIGETEARARKFEKKTSKGYKLWKKKKSEKYKDEHLEESYLKQKKMVAGLKMKHELRQKISALKQEQMKYTPKKRTFMGNLGVIAGNMGKQFSAINTAMGGKPQTKHGKVGKAVRKKIAQKTKPVSVNDLLKGMPE